MRDFPYCSIDGGEYRIILTSFFDWLSPRSRIQTLQPKKMTMISPRHEVEMFHILAELTKNVGRRMGIEIRPYETATVKDESDDVHWMYRFDDLEFRVYRIQRSFQRFIEIRCDNKELIDLDDAETQIRRAFLELNHKAL